MGLGWLLLLFVGLLGVTDGGSGSGGSSSSLPSSRQSHHDRLSSSSSSSTSKPRNHLDDEDEDYEEEYKDELDDLEDDYVLHPKGTGNGKKGGGGGGLGERREWVSISCPLELRGHCHCGHGRDPADKARLRPIVNCTHAGFTDTEFFKHVPQNTEVLIVVGNSLKELPQNLFGPSRDMLNLKELDLRQNGIELVRGKTFHRIPHLETLTLSFNAIRGSVLLDHPRLFSNLPELKYLHLTSAFQSDPWTLLNGLAETFAQSNLTKLLKLHLEQNEIARIPNPRQFCDLPSLLDLHLGQNQLVELVLDVDIDNCLPALRFVDLSYNHVRGVSASSGIFSLLNHRSQTGVLVRVELYHNPFICDCSLDTFLVWMRNMTLLDPDIFRHRTEMRCKTGVPESNAMRMLQDVDHTECPPALITTNAVINRLSWSVVSLIAISALMGMVVLWLKSWGLPSCLRISMTNHPLLSTTTSGVKYTSVDKEEAAEVAHV